MDTTADRGEHFMLLPEHLVGRGNCGRLKLNAVTRPQLASQRQVGGDYLTEYGVAANRLSISQQQDRIAVGRQLNSARQNRL